MIKISNFVGDNDNISVIEQKGIFTVFQHDYDLSVVPQTAEIKYYMGQCNCCPKQILVNLQNNAIRLAPGAMQMVLGNIQQTSGITGAGDLLMKGLKSKVTGDSAIKPVYKGTGTLITEPTYYYPIIEDVSTWNGLVCDDGMFICCDDEIKDTIVKRTDMSGAVFGGEGLFNLCLKGQGHAVLKSRCPREELYEIELQNDVIKIDGNNAVCWSSTLQFTVEKSGKSLLGSAASGEGLVNVYRGTGKILVAPRT